MTRGGAVKTDLGGVVIALFIFDSLCGNCF